MSALKRQHIASAEMIINQRTHAALFLAQKFQTVC